MCNVAFLTPAPICNIPLSPVQNILKKILRHFKMPRHCVIMFAPICNITLSPLLYSLEYLMFAGLITLGFLNCVATQYSNLAFIFSRACNNISTKPCYEDTLKLIQISYMAVGKYFVQMSSINFYSYQH